MLSIKKKLFKHTYNERFYSSSTKTNTVNIIATSNTRNPTTANGFSNVAHNNELPLLIGIKLLQLFIVWTERAAAQTETMRNVMSSILLTVGLQLETTRFFIMIKTFYVYGYMI